MRSLTDFLAGLPGIIPSRRDGSFSKVWDHLCCIDGQVKNVGGSWRFHTKELENFPKLEVEGNYVEFVAEITLLKPEKPDEPLTIPINRPVVVSES